ncbi:hypothetical protein Ahia01_001330600, partial [Argonauta hians]
SEAKPETMGSLPDCASSPNNDTTTTTTKDSVASMLINCPNFRRLCPGVRIYRSSRPDLLTEGETEYFRKVLDIRTILDLRSLREYKKASGDKLVADYYDMYKLKPPPKTPEPHREEEGEVEGEEEVDAEPIVPPHWEGGAGGGGGGGGSVRRRRAATNSSSTPSSSSLSSSSSSSSSSSLLSSPPPQPSPSRLATPTITITPSTATTTTTAAATSSTFPEERTTTPTTTTTNTTTTTTTTTNPTTNTTTTATTNDPTTTTTTTTDPNPTTTTTTTTEVDRRHYLLDIFQSYPWLMFCRAPWYVQLCSVFVLVFDVVCCTGLRYFTRLYVRRVLNPGGILGQYKDIIDIGRTQIRASLRLLSRPDRLPALLNCTYGKDRTGVLSALLLSLLGKDNAYIARNYAESAELLSSKREVLLEEMVYRYQLNESFILAREETMLELLQYIEQRFGSVADYLESIGFSREEQKRLCDNIRE